MSEEKFETHVMAEKVTPSYIENMIITPDGKYLITASDDKPPYRFWDAHNLEEVELPDLLSNIPDIRGILAVTPDGKYLVALYDKVTVISLSNPDEKNRTFKITDYITSHAVSNTHIYVYSSESDGIYSYEISSGNEEKISFKDPTTAIVVTPDNKYLLTRNSGGGIYRRHTSGRNRGYAEFSKPVANSPISDLALSADGKYIFAVSGEGYFGRWDIKTGKMERLFEDLDVGGGFYRILPTPNKKYIFLYGVNNNLYEYDLSTQNLIYSMDLESHAYDLLMDPLGNALFYSKGNTIHKIYAFTKTQQKEAFLSGLQLRDLII